MDIDDEDSICPFLELPEEMILHICSFLSVQDIVLSLSRVCRKFHEVLRSDDVWRTWISARWKRLYPVVEMKVEINWKEACYAVEQASQKWSGELRKFKVDGPHLSDVDCILFLNGSHRCATGSRDRNIILWDLCDTPSQITKKYAHDGWVWRLKLNNNILYSSSWDYSIKMWDIISDMTETAILKCETPVISVTVDEHSGEVYGGCFKNTFAFDPRVGTSPIFTINTTKPVLTLDILDNDLILGSENHTISVFDPRSRQIKQTVKLANSYPLGSQLLNGVLYVNSSSGNVFVYTKTGGQLVMAGAVDVGQTTPPCPSGLRVSKGCIITGSKDTVNVTLPLRPLYHVSEFRVGGVITGMDAHDGYLAVGTSNAVEFWLPPLDS